MGRKPENKKFLRRDAENIGQTKSRKSTQRAHQIFLCVLCVFVVGSLFLAPPPARAQPAYVPSADGGYVPDEVLVKLSGPVSSAQRKNLDKAGEVTDSGMELSDDNSLVVLKVPKGAVQQTIDDLQKQPGVVYAEPNYYAYAQDVIPNDPAWPSQYGPRHINAPAAWEISKGAAGVTIAIIDSGVDFNQLDLAPKLVAGHNYINPDDVPQDDFGHGTQVAGIAAAVTNNDLGIAGTSWGARIMPVKVLDEFGNGTFANLAAGIRFAARHGARVINLSLGGPGFSQTLQGAVNYAAGLGVVLVAAAGNHPSGSSSVLYPAAFPNVIAVSATDMTDNIASFSNSGPEVDLAAPGVDIISVGLDESLVTESGTSFSAPFVSGAAAILLGIPGNRYSSDVIRQLKTTAKDLGPGGPDDFYGNGLLQLDLALELAVNEQKEKDEHEGASGPSDTPEPAGGSGGGPGSGFGSGEASFTPTPTMTATPTSTATATSTPTLTATPTATSGGALFAEKATPQPPQPMPPMPVVAGFFLLAGMGLIGYALVLLRSR